METSEQQVTNGSRKTAAADSLLQSQGRIGIGVHDGLSALLARGARADFTWLSSFGVSAVHGMPDAGLLDGRGMLESVWQIQRLEGPPLIVDMDAGYGDASHACHATRAFARAGVAAVCIEDNPVSKRSSLYDLRHRPLATIDEHRARILAAVEGATGTDCRVVARTEAIVANLGVDEALRRCEEYLDAGASGLFVQAVRPDQLDQLLELAGRLQRRAALLTAPTAYPGVPARTFFEAGVTHVIYANQALRAAHRVMKELIPRLMNGSLGELEDQLSSVKDVSNEVGWQDLMKRDVERQERATRRSVSKGA